MTQTELLRLSHRLETLRLTLEEGTVEACIVQLDSIQAMVDLALGAGNGE